MHEESVAQGCKLRHDPTVALGGVPRCEQCRACGDPRFRAQIDGCVRQPQQQADLGAVKRPAVVGGRVGQRLPGVGGPPGGEVAGRRPRAHCSEPGAARVVTHFVTGDGAVAIVPLRRMRRRVVELDEPRDALKAHILQQCIHQPALEARWC